jgi:hypothetical protein
MERKPFHHKMEVKKMAKTKKVLLITVILSVLFISSAYAVLTPNARAAEINIQQKGLDMTKNVVGLDLSKYTVTQKEDTTDQQATYLGLIPQENVKYNLVSDSGELTVLYTFAEGKLQMIQVLDNFGKPITNKLPNVAPKMAYDFLSDYEAYTANPLYGELKSTLNNVDAGKNLTKTEGNTVLEITTIDDYTNFKWYYTANGAIAPYSKFISLSFKNGFLSAFVDNWQLYDVGNSNIKLSKEDAANMALEAARSHTWNGKLEDDTLYATKFNSSNIKWVSLTFDNSLGINNTRSENPLVLYPVWHVGIALDKWYGQLYGVVVDIWADTGEVRDVQEAWSTLPQPTTNANKEESPFTEAKFLLAFPSIVALVAGTLIWIIQKKKLHRQSLLKARSSKIVGLMLCILIASMIFSTPIMAVNATSRGAVVWGSESTGQNDPPGANRKTAQEIALQRSTAAYIAEAFGDNGYIGSSDSEINHQGSVNLGSSKQQILNDIYYLIGHNNYAAVVDFDHGVYGWPWDQIFPNEPHYMLEDNRGNWYDDDGPGPHPAELHTNTSGVYDEDIFGYGGSTQKIAFAFINTCMSASLALGQGLIYGQFPYPDRALGMPYAFTGRTVSYSTYAEPGKLSNDGYLHPDTGSQVYIGFPYGSASLEQRLPHPFYAGPQYYSWVMDFFDDALNIDISVNQALDSASRENFGTDFLISPLRTGFYAYWWPDDPVADCTMAVYGNGNIRLKNYDPSVHSVGRPTTYGPTSGQLNTNYTFTTSATDSYGHDIRYIFDWGDGSNTTTSYHPSGEKVSEAHSWTSDGEKVVTVTAQCENGEYGSGISYNTITIASYHLLTVYAFDAYLGEGYPLYPEVYIDGNPVGTAPVTVNLTATEHTMTADFTTYDPYWPALVHVVGVSGDVNGWTVLLSDSFTLYFYADEDSTSNIWYTQWW